MPESREPRLLSVRQAAERLNVSKPTVYRRIYEGSLPAVRIGEQAGPVRIPEDELEAWLYRAPLRADDVRDKTGTP